MRGAPKFRRWLYVNLNPAAWPKRGLSPLNRAIVTLITLAVVVAVIESEPTIHQGNVDVFLALEFVFGTIFLVEYVLRLWASAEDPDYGGGLSGYIRYALSLPALIDLLAVSTLFLTFFGNETAILRLVRLARILLLAKLGRYSTALRAIGHAVRSRRYELAMSAAVAAMLLLTSSTLLHIVEGGLQPEDFGSIPRAMWWSVATLTTVGYGDAVPVTPLGRIIAGLTAVTGIGLIAVPTGILAAAFGDAIRHHRIPQKKEDDEAV